MTFLLLNLGLGESCCLFLVALTTVGGGEGEPELLPLAEEEPETDTEPEREGEGEGEGEGECIFVDTFTTVTFSLGTAFPPFSPPLWAGLGVWLELSEEDPDGSLLLPPMTSDLLWGGVGGGVG